jgi:predicted CXXCH cytochrome family protein
MKKFAFNLLMVVAVLLAVLAGGALYASYSAGIKQHLSNENCATCHLAGKGVSALQAGMLTASQEALCGKCHAAAMQVSHPSGFRPKKTLPDAYPLDWKGDLTCSSCHDVHSSQHGLLRGNKAGKEFCFACHEADFFKKMRDDGASLVAGHLAKPAAGSAVALDAYAMKCMECHGSSATPKLATSIDRNGVVRHSSQSANHPIGMAYQKAVSFGGYRPRQEVERKLFLPNGTVSCVTCHSGYKKEHGKLVVPQERSALCFICHDL